MKRNRRMVVKSLPFSVSKDRGGHVQMFETFVQPVDRSQLDGFWDLRASAGR